MDRVFGPILVHNRDGLLRKAEADPRSNASEWVEDYVGMALKWALPVLAGTRPEWMPERWNEGVVLQLPARFDVGRLERLGGPVLATGRADFVDAELLKHAGVVMAGQRRSAGYTLGRPSSPDLPLEERVHMPERVPVTVGPGASVRYETAGSPVLTRQDRFIYWQPPDLADPSDALVPHSQIGTVSPYVEAARAMTELTAQAHGVRAVAPASHEPVTMSCWSSGGVVNVLLGNLESGWMLSLIHI